MQRNFCVDSPTNVLYEIMQLETISLTILCSRMTIKFLAQIDVWCVSFCEISPLYFFQLNFQGNLPREKLEQFVEGNIKLTQ